MVNQDLFNSYVYAIIGQLIGVLKGVNKDKGIENIDKIYKEMIYEIKKYDKNMDKITKIMNKKGLF